MSSRTFSRSALNDARRFLREATFHVTRPYRLPHPPQLSRSNTLARAFGNLRVRPKLMVLHNLFFLVLALAAYLSLIPLFERQVFEARTHEIALLRHAFSAGVPIESLKSLESHDFRKGTAEELAVPPAARDWLDAHPGEVWADAKESPYVFQKDAASGTFRRLRIANRTYRDVVARAQLTLSVVLGSIYIAAVLLLETAIMPLYVYGPLRLMLDADQATHRGDRARELIGPN